MCVCVWYIHFGVWWIADAAGVGRHSSMLCSSNCMEYHPSNLLEPFYVCGKSRCVCVNDTRVRMNVKGFTSWVSL